MDKEYLTGLKQYVGNTPPTEQRITEVGEVKAALAQSRELAEFVSRIVSLMVGSRPEACDGDGSADYEPDGVLPQLSAEARRCMGQMNAAMSDLRRLQKAMP